MSDRPQPLEIIKEGSEGRGHGEGLWGPGTLTLGAVHISVPSSRSVVWSWGGGSVVCHPHTYSSMRGLCERNMATHGHHPCVFLNSGGQESVRRTLFI